MMRDILTIARQQWLQNIKSLRSKVALALMFIWVTLPGFTRAFSQHILDDEERRSQVLTLIRLYNVNVAKYLLPCPAGLILTAALTFWLTPVVTLLLCCNRLTNNVDSAIVVTPLAPLSRRSVVIGKALSAWVMFVLLLLLIQIPVWITETVRGGYRLSNVLSWGGTLYFWGCLIGAAYVSLWVLLGSAFKTSRATLAAGLGLGLLLSLARITVRTFRPGFAKYFPGSLDELALSGFQSLAWQAVVIGLGWCLVTLVLATLLSNLSVPQRHKILKFQ
jgi:hypothetical protein